MEKENNKDELLKLKYIGYCYAQMPPFDRKLEDFATYAKFKLCEWRGYLMEDPVWDRYSEEHIISEYFAVRFAREEEFREEFETQNGIGDYDSIADWMDSEIKKNAKAVEGLKKQNVDPEKESEVEDEFEYVPRTIGD